MNAATFTSRALPCALLLAAGAAQTLAAPAHEHGRARLDVALEPAAIHLSLTLPLDTLVGFERAPRDEAERVRTKAVLAKLGDAAALFRIDPAAGCAPQHVELQAPPLQGKASAAGHADFEGRYQFRCTQAAKAGFIDVLLFDALAQLARIDVQAVLPQRQMQATLRRGAVRLQLQR